LTIDRGGYPEGVPLCVKRRRGRRFFLGGLLRVVERRSPVASRTSVEGAGDFGVGEEAGVDQVADPPFEGPDGFFAGLALGPFAFVVVAAGAVAKWMWVIAAMRTAWSSRGFPRLESR
jgi:hypothetical protein